MAGLVYGRSLPGDENTEMLSVRPGDLVPEGFHSEVLLTDLRLTGELRMSTPFGMFTYKKRDAAAVADALIALAGKVRDNA